MRSVPAELAAHFLEGTTSIAVCWRVTRSDGVIIRGTEHDQNIDIDEGDLAGVYTARAGITGSSVKSSSDLSVDNLEVSGSVPGDLSIVDLNPADIEAGLLDDAAVTLFMVNWRAPNDGQLVIRSGNLGNIVRTAEGRYTTELRGLSQRLRHTIIRTYDTKCDAELGDARCQADLSGRVAAGEVTVVVDRKFFSSTLTGGDTTPGDFIGGLLTWLTGDNEGFSMEVKRDNYNAVFGNIELYEQMPNQIQVGDLFSLTPGCDKTLATCRDRFDNVVNFRGYGVLVPGRDKISIFGGA